VKARPARTSSSGTKNRPTRSISSSKAWPLAWAWAALRCRRPGRRFHPPRHLRVTPRPGRLS
jgi:hypothetical protein